MTGPSSRPTARRPGQKAEIAEGAGRSRGGRTSQVHAAVNEDERPVRRDISGGHVHDSQMFDAFVDWSQEPLAIVAEKACGSHETRRQIAGEGAVAVIPSMSNAGQPIPHDPDLYATRTTAERFFCKTRDMRRLATRLVKLATNFFSLLYLFAIGFWPN